MTMTTSFKDIEYWLALHRAPGIGPAKFAQLLQKFQSPKDIFAISPLEWQKLGIKGALLAYFTSPDWSGVEKDMQWFAKPNNHIITWDDADYPPRLRAIHDPPPVLFVHGQRELLTTPQLAIVGTRRATSDGERTAIEFARYLSNAGLTITSGLALGIDAASHQGALQGTGQTIAVMGTGLDRVYPPQNRDLAHQIAEVGALISEFPITTQVHKGNFPRRNRIISGMSIGLLVVEASLRSGALSSARHASDQGRDVFVVPGSIHSPVTKGCHALIRDDGAKLVDNANDILEDLLIYLPQQTRTEVQKATVAITPTLPPQLQEQNEQLEPAQIKLLSYMGNEPTSVDNLVELSGLAPNEVSSMLLILELNGQVISQSGGLYKRTG